MNLLVLGCAPDVSGVVRDAVTERPVGGAVIELRDNGWGFRGGQLVWDAEKISRVLTGRDGQFTIGASGGHSLNIAAHGYEAVDTTLCARSPMIVRIGGPFAGVRPIRRLLFQREGRAEQQRISAHSHRAIVENVVLQASGTAFAGENILHVATNGGIRFVSGTGAIPPPPPLPYDRAVNIDLGKDCGWLFVSSRTSPVAVVQVSPLGWEQEPGRPRRWVMAYSQISR